MSLYDAVIYFFIYSFLGWCMEVAYVAIMQKEFVNRGFLNGPVCPIYGIGVITVVELLGRYADNILLLYVMSVLLTTILEGMTGFLMEKLFHRKWWDYSNMPFNLRGYVCLQISLLWGVGCVVVICGMHPIIEKAVAILPVIAGIIISVILFILMGIDFYATVTSILKMNRRLSEMDKIAKEMHRLSDLLGSSISRSTLANVEKYGQKANLLKQHYQELLKNQSAIDRRIFNAFPKMKHQNYEKQFQELREAVRIPFKKKKK